MTFRLVSGFPALAMLLIAPVGIGAAGCSPRAAEATTGAAPAPADGGTAAPSATPAVPTDPAPPTASAAVDSQFLKYDPATRTVTFLLRAGPFDWNGFTSGGATLTVPPGSANVVNFEQNDGTPHSAEISAGSGQIPNSGGDPAIPRAYTNKVVEGLPQGAKDVLRFTAPDSGTYRIICGVPGHALSGMWIWYKIDPAATAPSFGPTPK